jgi:hypothetical protein
MAKVMTRLSAQEQSYLRSGLNQPGGKLPLFDKSGQEINSRTILACVEKGYAERWFANPLKPEWLVCRLTKSGKNALQA